MRSELCLFQLVRSGHTSKHIRMSLGNWSFATTFPSFLSAHKKYGESFHLDARTINGKTATQQSFWTSTLANKRGHLYAVLLQHFSHTSAQIALASDGAEWKERTTAKIPIHFFLLFIYSWPPQSIYNTYAMRCRASTYTLSVLRLSPCAPCVDTCDVDDGWGCHYKCHFFFYTFLCLNFAGIVAGRWLLSALLDNINDDDNNVNEWTVNKLAMSRTSFRITQT